MNQLNKRIISGCAALALALALFVPLPARAAGGFPDVTDPALTEVTEVLRALGILSGTGGGLFEPEGTFDRASFCKMALIAMARGGEAGLQAGRVIFNDVTADHWALGFINAAAATGEGQTPLVRGTGDGRFQPDKPITFAEAVSILMRALGYSDTDLASPGVWYTGALSRAAAIGLTDGLSLGGEDTLTRAQAATLFYQLLFLPAKGASEPWLTKVLGGSITEPTVLIGQTDSVVKTAQRNLPLSRAPLPESLLYRPVRLVLDGDGGVLSAQADPDVTVRRVRISAAEARYFVVDGGERITVTSLTPVLHTDGATVPYGEVYTDFTTGTIALLSFNADGALHSLFLLDGDNAAVTLTAKTDPLSEFSALTGGAGAHLTVYKNGAPASLADARPYDVGRYNAVAGTLYLSDRRLTGIYENLAPSLASPERVTVMGASFDVLDAALPALSAFRLGDAITLLLDHENRVADAVHPDVLSAVAVGAAWLDGTRATVALPFGITVSGEVSLPVNTVSTIEGKLVEVRSAEHGKLTLRAIATGEVDGDWNVTAGKLGSRTVVPGVRIYERVGNSRLYPLEREQVTLSTVPSERILYAGINADGAVDTLLIDDVSGDCYTYGLWSTSVVSSADGGLVATNTALKVADAKQSVTIISGVTASLAERPIGAVPSLTLRGGYPIAAQLCTLTAARAIPRSAIRNGTATIRGTAYPLDPNLDDRCYNAISKTWFASLAEARAFSSTLTLYYDKSPDEGGKIRMVVVE